MAAVQAQSVAGSLLVPASLRETLTASIAPASSKAPRPTYLPAKLGGLDLPNELLEIVIFDTQLNLQDITNIALCCKRLSFLTVSGVWASAHDRHPTG